MSTMIPNIWIVEIDLLEVRMNGQSTIGNSTKSPAGVSQKYTTTVRTSPGVYLVFECLHL